MQVHYNVDDFEYIPTKIENIAQLFQSILECEDENDQSKEHVWVLGLNSDNTICYIELVSLGILDQTLLHPREIFRLAILKSCSRIILCHNHPQSNTIPSEDDITVTQQICDAGKIIGIDIVDHIIISSKDKYYSFKENKIVFNDDNNFYKYYYPGDIKYINVS